MAMALSWPFIVRMPMAVIGFLILAVLVLEVAAEWTANTGTYEWLGAGLFLVLLAAVSY